MISDKALLFKQSPAKVRFHPLLAHEMQQKMKQPSAYPLDGHADGCVFHQSFHSIFGGGSSVSFSRLQSDFPYTIFTPFRRGAVWNCMKLYSGHLYRKYAEIKNYRYLWSNIEI